MKLIKSENKIVSLENVIEVEKRVSEHTHTSYGKKYSLYNITIFINYSSGQTARIDFADQKDAKQGEELFDRIFSILSE